MTQTKDFLRFATKVVVLHTVSYFVCGLLMSNIFDYEAIFETDPVIKNFMRPIHAAWLGPLLQPLRGVLFAAALWPFWQFIGERRNGWLLVWSLFLVFGILSPPSAAPSSIEGVIYSRIPLWYHLMGLPEVLMQTLSFSVGLWLWARHENPAETRSTSSKAKQLLRAVAIGCFAYVGYAAGALVTLLLSSLRFASDIGVKIDRETLSSNFAAGSSNAKLQLMFVLALIVNVACIYAFERHQLGKRMRPWFMFLLFLSVDAAVPYIYQRVVLGTAPDVVTSVAIGLLPAMIVWFSLREPKPLHGSYDRLTSRVPPFPGV